MDLVKIALLSLLLVAAAAPALAQPPGRSIDGVVTRVVDGDSLWLRPPGGNEVEVRLRDIDAPEICQAWGEEARRALEEAVLGRSVALRTSGRDVHGRTLGRLSVDGADIGRRMVEEGHAWSTRTKWDRGPLVAQERMAAALRRGLHGQPGALMPRDFRRTHGPCIRGQAVARPTVPPPSAAGPVARPPTAADADPAPAPRWRCDGRTRCSQMTSCDEARHFLRNCPGVKMDGDGDGVPCEVQWCR